VPTQARRWNAEKEVDAPIETCAKVILAGEHFVVHGGPALAVPVASLRLCLVPALPGDPRPDRRLLAAWRLAAPGGPRRPPFGVVSDIPQGRGLGSSAALSVALVRAAARTAGQRPGWQAVASRAREVEAVFHGRSSGLDPAVIAAGRPLLWLGGTGARPRAHLLDVDLAGHVLVVAVLPGGRRTQRAVARVAALAHDRPAGFAALAESSGAVVEAAASALTGGGGAAGLSTAARARALGACLAHAHGLLRALGVTSVAADRLAGALSAAGALGAKLSGAGPGGAVVALAAEDRADRVSAAATASGAEVVLTVGLAGPCRGAREV
jgi:mevalonate kinase